MAAKVRLKLCLQKVLHSASVAAPRRGQFQFWIIRCLKRIGQYQAVGVTIRLVEMSEMVELNHAFRKKRQPTNVLSFEGAGWTRGQLDLGDLVLCPEVIIHEARTQGKRLLAHWAHLTLHGLLHLIGYDHQSEEQAIIMEGLEVELLNALGYLDPYQESEYNIAKQALLTETD